MFDPFQLKLWDQYKSNWMPRLFSLGILTCFTTMTETDMATLLWLKASQMGKGMEWIKFPFWSFNRRSTGTRPHSINYLCFSNCSQWYTGPAWCLQGPLTKHRHFNGWLPWDVPGLGKDTLRQCSFCLGSMPGVNTYLFVNWDKKPQLFTDEIPCLVQTHIIASPSTSPHYAFGARLS